MKAVASAVTRSWRGYAIGILSVVVVTVLIGALQPPWRVANVSMLYLIGVLATATLAGRGPAILVSVIAFLAFNWSSSNRFTP